MATSTITHQQLTEDYSCGYCLQRLPYMTDPRELPCSHVFCLPCLQADSGKDKGIECTVCGQFHEIPDFRVLHSPTITNIGQPSGRIHSMPFIQCDVCYGGTSDSIVFCTHCEKRLCEKHLEVHENFLQMFSQSRTHSVMDIEKYSNNASRYKNERCKEHGGENHVQACVKCHKTFCIKCQCGEICGDGEGNTGMPHTIVFLENLASQLRQQMETAMKSLSEKISESCKLEKNAWRGLDDVEVKARELTQEVDRITEEQICKIRAHSVELKEDIQRYLVKNTEHIEAYARSSLETKDQMEDLWRSANQYLIQSNDAEVVRQQKNFIKQQQKTSKTYLEQCRIFKGGLKPRVNSWGAHLIGLIPPSDAHAHGDHHGIGLRFMNQYSPPESVEYHTQYTGRDYTVQSTGKDVSNVCWTKDDQLILSGEQHLTLLDSNLTEITSSRMEGSTRSVVESESGYIGCSWTKMASSHQKKRNETTSTLTFYSAELQKTKSVDLLNSTHSNDSNYLLAVVPATHQIVVSDQARNELLFFTNQGDLEYTHKIGMIISSSGSPAQPIYLHILEDGCVLLVNSAAEGSISKYKFNERETLLIWRCSGLTSPTAITSDVAGFIYCVGITNNQPIIFIISEKGNLVRQITHNKLNDWKGNIRDIAVSGGDKLTLACGGNGVAVFNIVRRSQE